MLGPVLRALCQNDMKWNFSVHKVLLEHSLPFRYTVCGGFYCPVAGVSNRDRDGVTRNAQNIYDVPHRKRLLARVTV